MIHAKTSIRWKIDPRRLEPEAKKILEKSWKECSELAEADAKRRAPKGKTGDLAESIEATQVSYTGFRLICRADYGIFIETGTTAHWIFPKKKKALHWQEGGVDRFSKGHKVSGIEAKPFIQPAIWNNLPEFGEIHKKNFKDL